MPKIDINLNDEREDPLTKKETGQVPKTKQNPPAYPCAGLPSPYNEKWREYLRHKRQLNIGRVPEEIIKRFSDCAGKKNMTKIEYFYFLLKNGDPEIFNDMPDYDKMDRRSS